MIIYIVNWIERDAKRMATSSYSSAVRKYHDVKKQSETNPDISIAEPDQAIQKVEASKKQNIISIINGEL